MFSWVVLGFVLVVGGGVFWLILVSLVIGLILIFRCCVVMVMICRVVLWVIRCLLSVVEMVVM